MTCDVEVQLGNPFPGEPEFEFSLMGGPEFEGDCFTGPAEATDVDEVPIWDGSVEVTEDDTVTLQGANGPSGGDFRIEFSRIDCENITMMHEERGEVTCEEIRRHQNKYEY